VNRVVWGLVAALTILMSLSETVWADDPEPGAETRIVSPKIVGGSTAQEGAWPWQVAVLFNGMTPSNGQFCAGSLITPEWIVTAAHCADVTTNIDIQAGIHALSSGAGQKRDVSTVIVHPNYNSTTFNNDIALVKVSAPFTLNSTVSTIFPLTTEDGSLANPGVTATVTGWGTTSSSGSDSDVLLQVEVPIISTSDCNASTSYNGNVTANMICAGFIDDGGKDSCQGDSGGPLVVPEGSGWRLAGIVSWGIGCALPRFPGVYTRVSEMTDFINQHTGVFSADISLSKTVSPVKSSPEGELIFTIIVSNPGTDIMTSVSVADVLPVGLTLVSATTTQGTCSGGQTVTCDIGDLAANTSAVVTVKTKADVGFLGTITNTAFATTTSSETNIGNNSASASATISPMADLSIAKTSSADSIPAGGSLTYTLTVTNLGPSTSTQAVITDTLPTGLTLIASSTVGASCVGNSVITCTFGSIAPGADASVMLTTQVAEANLGTIINTAVISASTPQDPVSSNNSASTTTTILASDIEVSKTASVETLVAGQEVTYTIKVKNIGDATATGVTLSDALPGGLILVSAIATQGSCDLSVSCALGDIPVSSVVDVTIIAGVSLGVSGQIVNTVSASSTSFDRSTGNNQASVTVSVTPAPADLEITKTAPLGPITTGNEIVYTIRITNKGPATSMDTTMTDNLPDGVSKLSTTATQGSCTGTSKIVCDLGQLSVGESAEVTVRVLIASGTEGQLVNVAVASSTVPDNVMGNNTAVAVTQIPSVGVWGMAVLTVLLGLLSVWKVTSMKRRTA
jgi:uncharacterized repeat protein (TIGR01451 family)